MPSGEDRTFHQDDLFDYIDGGAELFLSFGFNQVFNRIYSAENQPDIYVDVFEMTSAYNAYGVFTLSTEQPVAEFGQGSQYTLGSILFWKDKYFISIITNPETPEAKEAIFEIATMIDEAIPKEGTLPQVLKYIPTNNFMPGSIRYFRHHHWQNSHLYLGYENFFNIDQTTHCALAKYKYDEGMTLLLLIEYPDDEKAQSGYANFTNDIILHDKFKTDPHTNKKTLTEARVFNNLLAVVFNSHNDTDLENLFSYIANKL